MTLAPTIHATAVLVGARAVLIRAGDGGAVPFARLVGDDRVHVEAAHGRLLVRPAATIAGLIEIRGLGIRRVAHEPVAAVGLVVDLGAGDAERLPARESTVTDVAGITLPRLAVAPRDAPLPLVIAALRTEDSGR